MRYIDESLANGETIIRRGKWPTIFWVGAWAALLLLGIIVVGVFMFAAAAIKMKTTDFAVTNRRVILKTGWLNRQTQELAVESVEGVSLNQSLIARLFGYGRVVVTGTGDAIIAFPPMARPVAFRRAIEAARADCGGEVHLARDDRAALDRIEEAANDKAANDQTAEEVVEEVEEEAPRKRRRASFIGLRARR
ncbi:MAG: PH domain-containing protein [Hyphomonadaceae bacterium]